MGCVAKKKAKVDGGVMEFWVWQLVDWGAKAAKSSSLWQLSSTPGVFGRLCSRSATSSKTRAAKYASRSRDSRTARDALIAVKWQCRHSLIAVYCNCPPCSSIPSLLSI